MEFNELSVANLREAARHFAPNEACGVGGIAHIGTKDQLIDFLRGKGIMACEVKEFCDGNKTVEPPVDIKPGIEGPSVGDSLELEYESDSMPESKADTTTSDETDGLASDKQDELEIIRKIIMKGAKSSEVDENAVNEIVDRKLETFGKKLKKNMSKTIEVKRPDLPNINIGICHYLTEQIAKVCACGVHQMLVGPAGGGKTTCCEKVAEILNLKFYPMSVGPQTTKSDLLGFIDAAGNYHSTPLREAFENGGLLLLDEVDAANAGVLTIINAMLANGFCSFPDGVKKKHEDFRCICACNTYGRGADRQYVGRNQLDAATLDRFAVVDFEYDEKLEYALAGNDEWVNKVQAYRKKAYELKMRVVISPRASINGARLLASGFKEKVVEEMVIWKGISEEIRKKIMSA